MRGAKNRIMGWLRSVAADPPSLRVGVLVSVLSVALATVAIFALKRVAPVVSLSVVYLPAVALVSLF
jgi:hypothetical protein